MCCQAVHWLFRCQWCRCLISISVQETSQHWTALIRFHNEIAIASDQKISVILLLLDLSAAFDTVDHCILLSRLSRRFGIGGRALEWFRLYLGDRTQFVNINGSTSKRRVLKFGVPQGLVLGLLLFSLYTSPLSDIASKHELSFHFYADDR